MNDTAQEKLPTTSGWGCTLSGAALLAGVLVAVKWSLVIGIPLCLAALFFAGKAIKKDSDRAKAQDARFKSAGPFVGDLRAARFERTWMIFQCH